MSTGRLGAGAVAGAGAPPADREALLAQVGVERRQLYLLVRQIVDALDVAAPWSLLYYPPDAQAELLALGEALIEVVDAIPERLEGEIRNDLERCDEETRQALEDAEFYFQGIHAMVSGDLERLRGRLEEAAAGAPRELPPGERNFLSALTADLKGKYSSALMGATASIVAEGLWSGVAVEPLLFPEKAEEFRRNEVLLATLQELLAAIQQLPREIDFSDLMERWRRGQRADPYALSDLAAFRAALGQLLKSANRRALYSGDYQQIQQREALLAARIGDLEALHRRLWEDALAAPEAAEACSRLGQLLLEVAAVLDVQLLERLVGRRQVADLRAVVTAESQVGGDASERAAHPRRQRVAPELRSLVPLLAEEDLRSYFELLLGAVRKRASLSAAAGAGAPAQEAAGADRADLLPEIDEALLSGLDRPPEGDATIGGAPDATGRPPWLPPSAQPSETQSRPAAAASAVSPRERLTVLEELHRILLELQTAAGSRWGALRMLQRLLSKHARVPPSMVQATQPFLFEILNTLVPQLEVASGLGAVPGDARQKLVANCMALCSPELGPEQMESTVPLALNRVLRLVEALTSVTAGQVRQLRQELGETA